MGVTKSIKINQRLRCCFFAAVLLLSKLFFNERIILKNKEKEKEKASN
jgi:hypothetical protein